MIKLQAMSKDKRVFLIIFLSVALAGMMLYLTGCKGCNKPVYIEPNPVQIIEQTHNPKIDSLKKLSFLLIDSIGKLNDQLEKQKTEQRFSERKASSTIDKLKDALAAKDTAKIIVYAEDAANDVVVYKDEVERLDSIQEAIIEKQAATIINNRDEIELHESKYNLIKTAYQVKEIEANDWKEAANKLDRKLKKKKFWNGVWKIGTAAGVVMAGIVFL
jgi:hypothetical protein